MLSYKEYKLLNESLYGAFNLGLKGHATVGGIVSDSPISGTEAAIEAESEESIEEAKKMKKKMLGDEDEVVKKVKVSDEDSDDSDDDDSEDKDEDDDDDSEDEDDDDDSEDEDDDDDSEDEDDDDDSEDEDKDAEDKSDEKEFAFMKKKMKKKAKKEWSEVMADLEEILEVVDDEEALTEVKKGLEMMKKGMEKGMKKHMGCGTKKCGKYMNEGKKSHKSDCDCPICEKKKDHEGEEKGEGLTAAQKKLPKALQDAILAKKSKKKGDDKCGKDMNEADKNWWDSVNGMLGSDPNKKNWSGWTEVGEVEQAVRKED